MCCKQVWPAGAYKAHPCGAKAKHIRDGKPYCGRHDPVRIKAKADAKHMQRLAEQGAKDAARAKYLAEAAEQKRRAECYDDLLAALKSAEELISGDLVGPVWKQACHDFSRTARALIAKCEAGK